LLWLKKKEDLAVNIMICVGACMAGLLQLRLLLWVQQQIFLVSAPWEQAAGGQQAPATGFEGLPQGVLVQDGRGDRWQSSCAVLLAVGADQGPQAVPCCSVILAATLALVEPVEAESLQAQQFLQSWHHWPCSGGDGPVFTAADNRICLLCGASCR
jgi:hypothetical protein